MDNELKNPQPSCALDAEIGAMLLAHPDGDFSGILKTDERFPVLYHLSGLPAGLLSWYPFQRASSLLQIGGGFGALTGILCDRCASVTVLERDAYRAAAIRRRWAGKPGLRVCAGGFDSLPPNQAYDYAVLVIGLDGFEPIFHDSGYLHLLRRSKALLSPGGTLLFSAANRFGVKYLCGAPDAVTGIPFDGVNGYPTGACAPSLSRPELADLVARAGFRHWKLYYPFPDHLLPQLVFTDEYPPDGAALRERYQTYQTAPGSMLADEASFYDLFSAEKLFPIFSNSFLVECGDGPPCSTIFSAISAERSRGESFSTSILRDGVVEKTPLYPEGKRGLERLARHLSALASRGVPTVPCTLEAHRLVMPRVTAPTLSQHLKHVVDTDPDALVAYLDRLYQYILQSSEQVPPERNALRHLAPNLDWGVVLQTAYLEMIPVNCFYEGDAFRFFDQEFTKENYPANYVMFRALSDVYGFIPQAGRYFPREALFARYGLTDTWPYFVEEERQFQDALRRREQFWHFSKWSKIDRKTIRKNGRLLLMKDKPEPAPTAQELHFFSVLGDYAGEALVLFGAGKMAEHYLARYGREHPPAWIVDNNPDKWSTEQWGYEVKGPQTLTGLDPRQYRVIVCGRAYPEISRQLTEMGVVNFRVYDRSVDELLDLAPERGSAQTDKYNIGYVTGVFDLFHIGHLNILRRSRERCEYLIAGVLTDEICIKEKGKKPFIPFEERLEIVRHLDCVDRVVAVDEHNTDKLAAWRQLRYDCFFSGSDHNWDLLRQKLRALGSNVEMFPYTDGTSSTALQELIKKGLL